LLDLGGAHMAPVSVNEQGGNLIWNLVFAAGPGNVSGVWVDGRQLLRRGEAVQVSQQAVIADAQRQGLALHEACRKLAHTRMSMV